MSNLVFDPTKWQARTVMFNGQPVNYVAVTELPYVARPVAAIQRLNVFAPAAYLRGATVNGYNAQTAPIFMPNTVGGYLPGPADDPQNQGYPSNDKTIIGALKRGYVVIAAGLRGRTTVGTDGTAVGHAPAFIVDMKAAVRYVKANRDRLPGNVDRIITNGTSAGGATSALMGASGNAAYFEPALTALGAAPTGQPLMVDATGAGTLRAAVAELVRASAQTALAHGVDVHKYAGIHVENQRVTAVDLAAYLVSLGRMKGVPAFDALDLSTPENNLFGDDQTAAKHFTTLAQERSTVKAAIADPDLVAAIDPVSQLRSHATTVAKHWRIRHGAADRDTSFAIPLILATVLQNQQRDVDFALPWDVPHSGDYDLGELFDWIDAKVKLP